MFLSSVAFLLFRLLANQICFSMSHLIDRLLARLSTRAQIRFLCQDVTNLSAGVAVVRNEGVGDCEA